MTTKGYTMTTHNINGLDKDEIQSKYFTFTVKGYYTTETINTLVDISWGTWDITQREDYLEISLSSYEERHDVTDTTLTLPDTYNVMHDYFDDLIDRWEIVIDTFYIECDARRITANKKQYIKAFNRVFSDYILCFGEGMGGELVTWDGIKRTNQKHYVQEIVKATQ